MIQAIYEFDYAIFNWMGMHSFPLLDKFLGLITHLGDGGIFCICFALCLLCFKKTRKMGACMGLALLIGLVICNLILKPAVNRVRPWNNTEYIYLMKITAEDILKKTSKLPPDASFPSGHTISTVEAAVALFCCNKKWGIPALFVAATVAFSRMYLCIHYPTDVFCAIILGIGIGISSYYIVTAFIKNKLPGLLEKYEKYKQNKKAKKSE